MVESADVRRKSMAITQRCNGTATTWTLPPLLSASSALQVGGRGRRTFVSAATLLIVLCLSGVGPSDCLRPPSPKLRARCRMLTCHHMRGGEQNERASMPISMSSAGNGQDSDSQNEQSHNNSSDDDDDNSNDDVKLKTTRDKAEESSRQNSQSARGRVTSVSNPSSSSLQEALNSIDYDSSDSDREIEKPDHLQASTTDFITELHQMNLVRNWKLAAIADGLFTKEPHTPALTSLTRSMQDHFKKWDPWSKSVVSACLHNDITQVGDLMATVRQSHGVRANLSL
eukprot:766544-Hanusia_phi.AAC.7